MKRISQSITVNMLFYSIYVVSLWVILSLLFKSYNIIYHYTLCCTIGIIYFIRVKVKKVVTLYWDNNDTYKVGNELFKYSQIQNIVITKELGVKYFSIYFNTISNANKEIILLDLMISNPLKKLYMKFYLTNGSS